MRNPDLSYITRSHPTQLCHFPNQPMKHTMPSGSKAGEDHFNNKSKQLTMTDRNRLGNASGPDTNTIVHESKPPRYTQSRFKEMFSSDDELKAKPVRMPLPADTLDRDGSAVAAGPLSVTESNAPSTASTYTGYEKPMQPVIQKSSGNKNPKVSVLPPNYLTKKIIEKKAEVSQETNSTGASLGNQENGGVAVVHDDDGATMAGVKSVEEEQYEGDDELSSGERSSV